MFPYSVKPKQSERGSATILFTVVLVFLLIPIVGLAIDGAVAFVMKTKLSAAIDAATLAAARSLSVGEDLSSQKQAAGETAQAYFQANFPNGLMNAQVNMPWSPDDVQETSDKVRTVTLTATAEAPLYFMSIFGLKTVTVAASGQASRRDVNVVMVLDRSGSMQTSGVCETMKGSAQSFVNKFSNGRDRLGLITFKGNANVDFATTLTFKPDLINEITTLQCSGDTGSAQALTLAHNQFLNGGTLKYPGALNVVVFFTDGQPNGVTGKFPIKDPDVCKSKTGTLDGFLAQGPAGVFDMTGVPLSQTSESALSGQQASGCSFQPSGSSRVVNDVAYIPDTDYFGNLISPGHWYVPSAPATIPVTTQYITNASLNAADNAASQIRDDKIVIYCIGESKSADSEFLKRVANTTDAVGYNSRQPTGLYVWSPDGGQLSSAFQMIASQILRISK